MCCPSRLLVSPLRATLIFLLICTAAACTGAGGATTDANAPFGIEVSQTYITLENRTGAPIVEGELAIVPLGVLPPFRAALSRIETGARRDYPFSSFRGNDGSPFSRGIARARTVRITAKDVAGREYQQEAPFN